MQTNVRSRDCRHNRRALALRNLRRIYQGSTTSSGGDCMRISELIGFLSFITLAALCAIPLTIMSIMEGRK